MSDPDRSSHWKFLADLLGAKPKQEPEVAEAEGLADEAAANPPAAASPVPPPPAARPKRAAPTGQLPNPQRHWGDVARELGVDVPMVPDEEIQQAPLQEPAQDSPPIVPAAREAVAEPMEESFAAPPEREIPAVSEATDNFLAEVGLVDDTFDALEEETVQSESADDGPAAREATSRSGPRRRRRGAKDDVETQTTHPLRTPATTRSNPPRSGKSTRGSGSGSGSAASGPAVNAPPSPVSGHRSHAGGSDDAGASVVPKNLAPANDTAGKRASPTIDPPPAQGVQRVRRRCDGRTRRSDGNRRAGRRGELDEIGELDDVDELDDVGELDELDERSELAARKARRSIPSWQEAIQDIVSHNLAGRQKPRRPRGGRGRRPNQRDR